ncbi:acetylcholine receptor subunit alpha-type acr-16-like isoform X2 [Littorina saxatilis]|uniref:Neurotransmitter-gated ion-channel ligand-binding domain-containing protein n=1 Tax=Littorina saxatilis TaxID=31220 RepID=A0AAN9AYA6_9CAEN
MAVFTRIILVACLAVCVSGAFKIRDDANGVPRSASEGDVIRDLLARHVKYGIPQPVGSLQVKLGLYVEAVTEVDVEKGTVEVVGFLSLQWEDPRLRFEHSDPFHEVKDVRLPASEVWRPDIELYTQFGSWTYQKHAMELAVNHPMGVLSQYRSTGQWTVSEATAERVEAKYECCPDTYVFVAYNLTLQKQDL